MPGASKLDHDLRLLRRHRVTGRDVLVFFLAGTTFTGGMGAQLRPELGLVAATLVAIPAGWAFGFLMVALARGYRRDPAPLQS
jgi:hypothetical protein